MKIKDDRKYWLWLSHACGQGSKVAVNLVRRFGGAYEVYSADDDEFDKCKIKIDSRVKARLTYKDTSEEESIIRWCDEVGVRIISPRDEVYPVALRTTANAPMVLYCIGKLPDWNERFCCSVVGTRKMSEYGKEMSYNFGSGLAAGGALVISGLATGCDTYAIKGALDAGGIVIAVLGNGIDVVYPRENRDLYDRIVQKGAIITEYAPGISPIGSHFPVRNRIISGMAQATCVVEGGLTSGSLITARHALYQGRDVFAVPGQADGKFSEGTNFLIKNGAKAVTSATEILEYFSFLYPHSIEIKKQPKAWVNKVEEEADIKLLPKKKKVKKKKKEEPIFAETPQKTVTFDFELISETERKVYRAMTPDLPMIAEEICEVCKLPVSTVMASLTILEMTGTVESGAGGYFMRHADNEEVGEPAITEFDEGM